MLSKHFAECFGDYAGLARMFEDVFRRWKVVWLIFCFSCLVPRWIPCY